MGILGALSTSVSGLSAQSYALENISGNIANASTVGFKRVDTSFTDLIPDQPKGQELSGSVSASSQLTNTIQGSLTSTGVSTNVAISGDGFFVVAKNNGSTAAPTFSTQNMYTRRGDFKQDASGYLVNGAGYYMAGTTYDPTTGAAVGISPSPIQISNAALAAQKTSTVNYSGNLPSLPKPTTYTGTAGSELLAGSKTVGTAAAAPTIPATAAAAPANSYTVSFSVDGVSKSITVKGAVTTPSAAADTATTIAQALNDQIGPTATVFSVDGSGNLKIDSPDATISMDPTSRTALGFTDPLTYTPLTSFSGANSASFINESISGGQATVYTNTGTAESLQLRWAKVDSTTVGGADTWQLYYQSSSDASAATAWQSLGSPVAFDPSGKTSTSSIDMSSLTIGGVSVGDIKLDLSGGLTQYGDSSGAASVNLDQNGYTSGALSSVSIGSDGTITGSYSNGQAKKLGEIAIAQFAGADGLKSENGGAYSATTESGNPTYSMSGVTLTGGSVEASNTDISAEFSKMIVTQQAYSANTKVMSTAQQMLQDIINIVR